ncbi:MAG: ABC transporter substrate-binding protein [Nitrospinota bacterium]|nr:ABC transporter substrate-binding protein [Nitrospinota bacterium]
MKLVSLLPSATDIVARLGLESHLVGISHECDYPESITHLPRVTSSSVKVDGTSGSIHESVQKLLEKALTVYDLDIEKLKELQPDYLITQDLCDVCAVSFDQVETACREVLDHDTKIISLHPHRLEDVWEDVQRVGETLGATEAAESFRKDIQQRIEFIRQRVPAGGHSKPEVLTIEWFDPFFIGGMWVPEMIEIVGGAALLAAAGKKARSLGKEQLGDINPDVVVVKPCGYSLEKTLAEFEDLKKTLPWKNWNAARNHRIYLVDGNTYFNRPGPRIMDSLEILAFCVHPEGFPEFGEKYHKGMIRLEPQFRLPGS